MSDPKTYTVGWICPLPKELVAATICLDKKHPRLEYRAEGDNTNIYTLGEINGHNVVLAGLPSGTMGRASATIVTANLFHTFPNVRIVLMVGIGGGAPLLPYRDIRLGDIVVSRPGDGTPGVIQYDYGKYIQGEGFHQTMSLGRPAPALLAGVTQLDTDCKLDRGRLERAMKEVLERQDEELQEELARPDETRDTLFESNVVHQKGTSCAEECAVLVSSIVPRQSRARRPKTPRVHYGLIASADTLMKNALDRDLFAQEQQVLCFEMEAAGLMNDFPCLVVRGISDYSDSHKNDDWQEYAALAAAVYARELLVTIPLYQVEREERVASLIPREINDKVGGITRGVQHLHHRQDNQDEQATLKWFSELNFATKQNEIMNERQAGTVQRLLNSEDYQEWLRNERKTLYCEGMPGAGKTFAAATVINDLQRKLGSDENQGLAYVYLNYRHREPPRDLASSILQQLAERRSSLPSTVRELHERHQRNRTLPSLDELSNALVAVSELCSRVYIVVDALDEYESVNRKIFLDSLCHLQEMTGANILVTSRVNEDTRRYFQGSVKLEVRASDEDVAQYLDNCLSNMQILNHSEGLKEEIKQTITDRAQGMFLLARLHMTSLAGCTTTNDFRARLTQLPDGARAYDQSYDNILERIRNQPSGYKELAMKILCWVTFARRVLSFRELKHAMAVKFGSTSFDEGDIPMVMLDVCAGLVTTENDPDNEGDEDTLGVRLIHYTTQEYLQDARRRVFEDAHAQITKTCITYLSLKDFERSCSTKADLGRRLVTYPLYKYAATTWGEHARQTESLCDEVMVFLASSGGPINAAFQGLRHVDDLDFEAQWQVIGLHLASLFGMQKVVEKLLLHHDQNAVDPITVLEETPLYFAAQRGHTQIVQLLLEKGANINKADNWGNTPLNYTTELGYMQIVQLLLEKGADVNKANDDGETPLQIASIEGHTQIVQLLLEEGANVNKADDRGWTPLQWAARRGHTQIVQLLLEKGADINEGDTDGHTPLNFAADGGNTQIVQLLLEKGVDIDKATDDGNTPLHLAAEGGHEQIVQQLLEKGADVDKANDDRVTPLYLAAKGGNAQIMQLLFEKGANVNKADKYGRTPLDAAARDKREGHEQIVQQLHKNGAFIKASTILRRPQWVGYIKEDRQVMQLLVEAGVDINEFDPHDRISMVDVVEDEHTLVKLLLHLAPYDHRHPFHYR